MRTTISKFAALAAVAAMAIGAGSAQARHGADDPAGHIRHGRGADDVQPHKRQRADDSRRHHRHHHHARHHGRHGADDGPNHR
jgi:hypothetical protein